MTTTIGDAPAARVHVTQEHIVLLVTLGLAAFLAMQFPSFRTTDNLITVLRSVAVLGVLSIGLGVVVINRGLDLSIIATMIVTPAVTVQLLQNGSSLLVAMVAGLTVAVVIGLLNGCLVAFVEIPSFFATLATGLLIYGVGRQSVIGERIIQVPGERSGFLAFGQNSLPGVPIPVVVAVVVAVGVAFGMRRTRIGRFIYVHGANPDAARLTGVPTRPLTVLGFVVAAVLAFVAGVLQVSSAGALNTAIISSSLIYDVFTVVVIGGISLVGGRGGVLSAVAGTLLIGVLLNGMTLFDMSVYEQSIFKGLVLLGAVILDNRLHPRDEETVRQGD